MTSGHVTSLICFILSWPDQKVITDRKKTPQLGLLGKCKIKCNKRAIINISEIRIYLWRVVEQKEYRDCGQEPGVGYGPDSLSHGVLNR